MGFSVLQQLSYAYTKAHYGSAFDWQLVGYGSLTFLFTVQYTNFLNNPSNCVCYRLVNIHTNAPEHPSHWSQSNPAKATELLGQH